MKKYIFSSLAILLFITGCGCEKEITIEEEYAEEYTVAEEQMLTAAKAMVTAEGNETLLPTAEIKIKSLSLKNLQDYNYLKETLTDPSDSNVPCNEIDSYVRIEFENGEIIYTVYLECGNYKTEK